MEAVLRALADESRRTVLETLASGPATAGDLAELLPIARPGGSRHLRVLRQAGGGPGGGPRGGAAAVLQPAPRAARGDRRMASPVPGPVGAPARCPAHRG